MPEPRPRDAVIRMAPYHPPSGGREGGLRLDFNENTEGCSPRVLEAIREALNPPALSMYPEYSEARKVFAKHFGVADEQMLLTNGTDEAIQLLVQAYVDDGDAVVTLRPSYAMYRFYAELAGGLVRDIPFPPDLSFPERELLAAAGEGARVVLIASPNNPTGSATTLNFIRRLLAAVPAAAVLVDEAYFEFHGVTALPLIDEFPNLFVCRTFSKAYGMAALRFGCLFTNAENAQHLRKAQSPYSVNSVAVIAARAAVQDPEYVAAYVRNSLAARRQIGEELDRLGIRHFPSAANFVLFEAGERAGALCAELRRRGVLVRDRSYELSGCVRVTTGTLPQAERFLEELKQLW